MNILTAILSNIKLSLTTEYSLYLSVGIDVAVAADYTQYALPCAYVMLALNSLSTLKRHYVLFNQNQLQFLFLVECNNFPYSTFHFNLRHAYRNESLK